MASIVLRCPRNPHMKMSVQGLTVPADDAKEAEACIRGHQGGNGLGQIILMNVGASVEPEVMHDILAHWPETDLEVISFAGEGLRSAAVVDAICRGLSVGPDENHMRLFKLDVVKFDAPSWSNAHSASVYGLIDKHQVRRFRFAANGKMVGLSLNEYVRRVRITCPDAPETRFELNELVQRAKSLCQTEVIVEHAT